MKYAFLLIGEETDTQWPLVLSQALSSLGKLRAVSEEEAIQAVIQRRYDVVIIDAGTVHDVVLLVSRLWAQQPQSRIIVATASPTWKRAREILRAGAADYIRKSLDRKELRSKIQVVLEAPPPSGP